MTAVLAIVASHVTSKGPSMTRTVFFNQPAPANGSMGGRPAAVSSSAASSSFLRKALNVVQFLLPGTASGVETPSQPYPWLTATMRRNMSPRAQRLIRADY
jgi:hypothetical protein